MWQFLQTYGFWIVFGIFFLLMIRMHFSGMSSMHGGGGGCGMGMGQDHSDEPSNTQRAVTLYDSTIESQSVVPLNNADSDPQNETFEREIPTEKEEIPSSQYPVGYHTSRY